MSQNEQRRMRSSDLPPDVVRSEDFQGELSDYNQPSVFSPLEADKFTVTLIGAGGHRKLFKLQLRRTLQGEMDLAVHLPYFMHYHGKIGKYSMPAAEGGEVDLPILHDDAFTTTREVKLSHHADGRIHFSQDSRVFTKVITHGTPVNLLNGPFFTFQFWGLNGFESVEPPGLKEPKPKSTEVYFGIDDDLDPTAVAGGIIGYCYPYGSREIKSKGGPVSDPRLPLLATRGSFRGRPAIVVRPRQPKPDNDIEILLEYISGDRSSVPGASTLTLIGGYHIPPPARAATEAASFIAVTYAPPQEDWDELAEQFGSIDYLPGLSDKVAGEDQNL